MKKLILSLGCIFSILAAATPTFALPRVFVSGFGNNANPGTLNSPVRSLAKAMTLVDPKGEIIILDSANYAPVTITKPVTIAATGVEAEIEPGAFADGIVVDVGSSEAVTLRALTINGGGVGIRFIGGKALHVENCVIKRASDDGISSTGAGHIFIKDTIIADCGGQGIYLASPSLRLSANNVRLENNHTGFEARAGCKVWISHSVMSGNDNWGAHVVSNGSATEVDLEDCAATGNGAGLACESSSSGVATIRASNLTVTGNTTGLSISGAGTNNLLTRRNNTVEGNTVNGTFTGSFNPK